VRRPLLLACCLLLTAPGLLGAAPAATGITDFSVRTWNESDGLAATRIMALEQDHDGYLWLGTDVGLVRFDGVQFVPVTEIGGVRLPVAPTSALLSASDRSLWMGSITRFGVARIKDGTLIEYGEKDGLPGWYAMALLEDRKGRIWVGNSVGLFTFDGRRWHAVQDAALRGAAVLALLETQDGRIWAASRSAVYRRDREGEPFQQVDVITRSSNVWQGLSEGPDGSVWISDFQRGFRQVGASPAHAEKGWGAQLLHDRRGNLWIATRGQGLWRVHPDRRGTPPPPDVITRQQGLATDAVQCIMEDREGNLWVGTYAGLQRLTPHRVTPISDVPLARAAATTRDGSVWIGGTGGLTQFRRGATRRRFTEAEGLPGAVVLAVHADHDGTVWVSTELGLARFADGRFTKVLDLDDEVGIQRIFSIARTRAGLWVRDVNFRLHRMSADGRMVYPAEVPRVFSVDAVALAADTRDRLWIGATDGRLGVLHPDGTFTEYTLGIGDVRSLHESAGVMWAGGDDGLGRIENGEVSTIGTRQGLPSHVKSIVEDADGVLWVGVASGIVRIEKSAFSRAAAGRGARLAYRLFNTADGAAGVPVNDGGRSAVLGYDGRLWFATSAGVTVIDPHDTGEPRPLAPAVVESITADAKPMPLAAGAMLPANVSHVQFGFTALALTDSMRLEFKYRLDGIDRDWVHAGTNRQASYTNLGPGQYTFRVVASNADGVWSEPGAVLQFGISPTFYQTRWFYALCALAAFSAGFGAWRLHGRRVRGQFALVLAERIRMSRAIHDTLLQGLAGLALQLDDLDHGADGRPETTRERIRRIRRRVEESIREARQSIWDLRSPVLERRSFPEALREVGTRAVADMPVAFDVNVKGTPRPCSPVVEQQLLLICQEALANAVKHGRPSCVDVELEYAGDKVRVRVTDDGRGFDLATIEKVNGHYGVVSMHERAAQVRGRLTIASAPGQGTRVETIVPAH
jgi:signal transduction histidine kinase/ligand-binding sensor domain-containing protein